MPSRYSGGSPAALSFALALLFALASGAEAQTNRWVEFGATTFHPQATSEAFDMRTIQVEGSVVEVWTRRLYGEPQRFDDGAQYDEVLLKERFDCDRRTNTVLRAIARLGGDVVHSEDRPMPENEPIPGSVAEGKWMHFCEEAPEE
ncbi:MAG: surface-adhesin E family protein [Bacteroidota bacterium]